MTPEQSAQLVTLVRQAGFGSLIGMTGSKRDDFAARASAFLTSTQLKAISELQDERAATFAVVRQRK